MKQVTGTVIVVQEGRFRLMSDAGQAMLFLLSPGAALEPQDLPGLLWRRVRVQYAERDGLIAGLAEDVAAAPLGAPRERMSG